MPLPAFLHAGRITWTRAGGDVYFQINFTAPGSGLDLSRYKTLDFRVERETPARAPGANPAGPTNFHLQLVQADGSLSDAVASANFTELVGPFGTPDADFTPPASLPDGYHLNMATARIPMDSFDLDELDQIRGIRLTFDATPIGKIYVTNFRASSKGVRSLDEGGDQPGGFDGV